MGKLIPIPDAKIARTSEREKRCSKEKGPHTVPINIVKHVETVGGPVDGKYGEGPSQCFEIAAISIFLMCG